jgi:hypothetical protein
MVEDANKENERLKEENESLKTRLIDLTFEMNYNKQNELLELVRTLYGEILLEINDKESKLTKKKQILNNVKKYLEEFAKNNKIRI